MIKIALDLRLADLPGGGFSYAAHLLPALLALKQPVQWQIYHNPNSIPQNQIIQQLASATTAPTNTNLPDNIELRPVRSRCLSLTQHLEFFFTPSNAQIYHYLHFDMPLGIRNLPLVITIHDLYPISIPHYCSPLKRAYFHHLTKHNCQRAAAVIAISQYTKADIIRLLGIPENKIFVVPQSQAAQFQPIQDPDILQPVQQRYHLPQNFIFYTGNHKPHKNLDRLIQAYARLPQSLRREFPLVLTGRVGPDTAPLQNRAQQLNITDSVRFLNWVEEDDMPAIYNLASLVVLPSLYEGFGLAPLEAMACGTCVACSNTTAIPEVVGKLGRLFDPTNIDQITNAIQNALTKDFPNTQLVAAHIKHAANFSKQKTAQMTFDVYQHTIRNTTP
ncbi:MAG: glycosyltransferase family 4 protein [Sedimentisphaerales bacterium]|nr:glycosyltransferase family 4 protein [Sedimentisphaerales bacterium]